ncbi:NAD(P)/FAD-dependent oxidoreductase [Treponema pedis]|uniref:NAD(P)/FAD-dependent oxidoreductase n=1 Tax=Treponema pedis TaxID=409322 RepID=UPI000494CAAC|nr:NAD(P)/FAD-dependent oxidoreductase [Treponema pedis]
MYDIVIIGAGVVGACTAWELSKYELKILVLEKELEAGCGTSKANSGIIHGGYDAKEGSLKAKLNVRGNFLVRSLKDKLGIHFSQCGSLVIAFSEEEMNTVHELYKRGITNGAELLEIWDKEKLLKEEPNISKEAIGALYCGSAGVVCPFDMTFAFLENAITNGAEFLSERKVVSIEKINEGYSVKTEKDCFKTKFVINAAGLYSDKIAEMAGDKDFKILPRRGEYRVFDKSYEGLVKKICFQAPSKMGKGILVLPSYYGNFLTGPSAEDIKEVDDTSVSALGLSAVDAKSLKTVPSLNFKNTIRIFSGVRACPDTGDFMIYASKNSKGIIHAGGIESPGLSSAPAIGEYIAALLKQEGKSSGVEFTEKKNFKGLRSPIPHFASLSEEEQNELIKKDKKYSHIVCRCETVTEAEIVQAIHRPAGARTVDGVKRRVRPGSGRCQGGFCGPLVLQILSRELNIPVEQIKKERAGARIIYGKLKGGNK